jgi:hypothetical protein
MEDEEEGQPDMVPVMRSFALTATAEFILVVGIVFVLLGVANFLTDYLKVKGSGEALVGAAMVVIAFILLIRIRPGRVRVQQPPPFGGDDVRDSGDYR